MTSDLVGKTIAGCTVTELIGQGGMGLVYKAHHIVLDQDRALKVMDPFIARDQTFMRRFEAEARSLARLRSPHIVSVYDLCQTDIGTCLVMEYVHGRTLADIIKETDGPMEESRVFHLFKQILVAIEHAHAASVIHRDIKPGNILVTEFDDVKVTDFGLAKIQEHGTATVTQLTGGTIYYMSPEQLEGLGKVDHRGDLYSLGMTMYEALTGSAPFEKTESDFGIREKIVKGKIPPPKSANPKISASMNAFVMKALARDPERRFQSAVEMRAALEKIEREFNTDMHPPARSSGFDGRKIAMIAGVAVVLVLGGYFIYKLLTPVPSILAIASSPSGARVELNGSRVGDTPIKVQMPGGTVSVRVAKQGYEKKDTSLELASGDSLRFLFRLKSEQVAVVPPRKEEVAPPPPPVKKKEEVPKVTKAAVSTSLNIVCNSPGAAIYIDRVLQRDDPPYSVKPGDHDIKVVYRNNKWEKRVKVRPGRTERVVVNFNRRIKLTVFVHDVDPSGKPDTTRSISSCWVYVDGKEVASRTPSTFQIPMGTHTITVRHPTRGDAPPMVGTFEEDRVLRFALKK